VQDLIHALGTVVDDSDAVSKFMVQEVHISLFTFDEDDMGAGLTADEDFISPTTTKEYKAEKG
jgi:hypothetical protein